MEKTHNFVRSLCLDNICFDCGLCCNGTIFDKVRVEGGDDLILPCINLTNENKCSIYENRPERCKVFECKILWAYKQDKITRVNALQLIEDTKNGIVTRDQFLTGKGTEKYYE